MKTTGLRPHRGREGSTLVAVMGVSLLIAMMIVGMVAIGRQQIFSARYLRDRVKAQMIAEAGANEAYNLLKTNFAARTNPDNFPLTAFDGGTYDATVTSVNTSKVAIACVGIHGTATAHTKLDVRNYPRPLTNAPSAFSLNPYSYAALSGGYVEWVGNENLQMSNAWMHANGTYYANGANHFYGNIASCERISMNGGAVIDGNACAPVVEGGTAGSTQIGAVPLVSIPDIDLTPYYNAALAAGQVHTGDLTLSGTVSPSGGILWVNGDLTIANGDFTGCFIATGNIEIKTTTSTGTVNMDGVGKYPLLVSRDGSILVKQANEFNFDGLIYCKTGSFDKQGNGEVYGTGEIIAAGNITKNGGWAGMIYRDCTPVPPGGVAVSSVDHAVITAWQE